MHGHCDVHRMHQEITGCSPKANVLVVQGHPIAGSCHSDISIEAYPQHDKVSTKHLCTPRDSWRSKRPLESLASGDPWLGQQVWEMGLSMRFQRYHSRIDCLAPELWLACCIVDEGALQVSMDMELQPAESLPAHAMASTPGPSSDSPQQSSTVQCGALLRNN